MTTQIQPRLADDVEKTLAQMSFSTFLDYVYILEPPQAFSGRPGGKIRFEKWGYLLEIAEALESHSHVVVLKARQIGFSWLMAAYAVWYARFHEGAVVLMLSRGEKEAAALLGKAKTIYGYLPESWQLPIGKDSGSEFTVPSMDSKIIALPSTKDAGRSETASVVIQDEADFHEYLDDNYSAVGPTIDAGGQIVMGSTSNKRRMASLFKNFYKGAPSNGWKELFYGWMARSERTDDWYEQRKNNIPHDELQELTPEQYMEQEYPVSAAEALAPSRTQGYFDHDVLVALQAEVRKPIRQYPIYSLATGGVISHIDIYWHVSLKGVYAAGTDTSHGKGRDYSVTVVYDYASRRVVADICSNEIEPDEFAAASLQLMKLYNEPLWAIEDNDRGIEVVKAAKKAGYWNLYHRETGGVKGGRIGRAKQPGWHTTDAPDSRPVLWAQLSSALRRGDIIIPNERGLAQCFDIIQNPSKGNRPEAAAGSNDDYPMAVGLAWQMIERSPRFAESANTVSRKRSRKKAMPAMW